MLQDVLGGGTCPGAGAAQAEGGPVQEDGGGGQRGADSWGAFPARRHQAPLHAVEGDHELYQHPGLQDRRDQGRGSDMDIIYMSFYVIFLNSKDELMIIITMAVLNDLKPLPLPL